MSAGFYSGAPTQASILRERARVLAVRPEPEQLATASSIDLLEFRLAGERYAIETRFVDEVHPLTDLTELPGTPAFVMGIVNVRGRMITVISFRNFFGLPETGLNDVHRIILVRSAGIEIGLPADADVSLRTLAGTELQPGLAVGGQMAECIRGITPDGVTVLDIARFCSSPQLLVDEGGNGNGDSSASGLQD